MCCASGLRGTTSAHGISGLRQYTIMAGPRVCSCVSSSPEDTICLHFIQAPARDTARTLMAFTGNACSNEQHLNGTHCCCC